jgi:two-component system, OmpR family, response regulator
MTTDRLVGGLETDLRRRTLSVMGESQATARPPTERRRGGAALRILVVDDERDTVDSLSLILKNEGHVVHAVFSGKDVLSAVSLFRPDAIIMEIALPGMSGYAVAQVIRGSFTAIRRPLLIAVSGMWKETPDRMVAHQVGFDHHLSKPYAPEEVLRLLQPLRRPSA